MAERIEDLGVAELGRRFRAGTLTSETLTRRLLSRIDELDPKYHAFITVTKERALADARRADEELKAGKDRGGFHGIPYALKDIYDTKGIRTTCQSKLRIDHIPEADSVVEEKLHAAGGVLLGKLTTMEFANGGPDFTLPFPPARNPWNHDHLTSGSSSGSGAAVAARFTRVAMGSDTAGSIRGPSCFCGTVGLKPTYGRVSRRGVFPLAYTLDHCGPLATTVEDAALALQAIAGFDPEDPASADLPVPDFRADLDKGVAGLRIGVTRHFYESSPALQPEIAAAINKTVQQLRDAGATVEDVTLKDYSLFFACGRVIQEAETGAIHEADLQRRPQDYGQQTIQRFILGSTLSAVDLVQALRVRRELTRNVNDTLMRYDALITACALITAPTFDEFKGMAWTASQSMPFNVTGHPAMAVPLGFGQRKMPLGLQIVGRPFDENMVLRVGRAIETLSGWDKVPPPV